MRGPFIDRNESESESEEQRNRVQITNIRTLAGRILSRDGERVELDRSLLKRIRRRLSLDDTVSEVSYDLGEKMPTSLQLLLNAGLGYVPGVTLRQRFNTKGPTETDIILRKKSLTTGEFETVLEVYLPRISGQQIDSKDIRKTMVFVPDETMGLVSYNEFRRGRNADSLITQKLLPALRIISSGK